MSKNSTRKSECSQSIENLNVQICILVHIQDPKPILRANLHITHSNFITVRKSFFKTSLKKVLLNGALNSLCYKNVHHKIKWLKRLRVTRNLRQMSATFETLVLKSAFPKNVTTCLFGCIGNRLFL